jgi:hypothetical protein
LSQLSLFFHLIKDNSWHSVNELSKALNVPPDRLIEMSKLLSEHNLIEYRQNKGQVKINPKWKFIFEEYNESEEEKQSVGTIMVPPEKSVKLQGITVTNLTDTSLELNVRMNRELKEITINRIK